MWRGLRCTAHDLHSLLGIWDAQGRPANCEFIGYVKSPQPMSVDGCVANHDELMSNFFAQPVGQATATELHIKLHQPNDNTGIGIG